jgi:choline dehydrogenase-like flavoprotein
MGRVPKQLGQRSSCGPVGVRAWRQANQPNNEEGHKRLIKKLQTLMQQQTKCSVHGLECREGLVACNLFLGQRIPLAEVAHQNGTVRFGDDPKNSALDRNCKAHELDNLYVVDASFFCSSGAVNPALTIIANALRVGDHLLERMGAERSDERVMTAVA